MLTVGVTGAGKASVIWAIIAGLVPFILAGLVNLWVIDPKGGIELAPGRHLFTRSPTATPSPPAATRTASPNCLRTPWLCCGNGSTVRAPAHATVGRSTVENIFCARLAHGSAFREYGRAPTGRKVK